MKGVIEVRHGKKAFCYRYKNIFEYYLRIIKCSINGYDTVINHRQ
jgi:hypothetical protein